LYLLLSLLSSELASLPESTDCCLQILRGFALPLVFTSADGPASVTDLPLASSSCCAFAAIFSFTESLKRPNQNTEPNDQFFSYQQHVTVRATGIGERLQVRTSAFLQVRTRMTRLETFKTRHNVVHATVERVR
jgi:hypothetical protein